MINRELDFGKCKKKRFLLQAPHEELFSTFVTMLEQIPMEQRIVLFVDDLHLLKETKWLSKLPQTFATLRLKMVATISDESEIKSKFQVSSILL